MKLFLLARFFFELGYFEFKRGNLLFTGNALFDVRAVIITEDNLREY